MDPVKVDSSRPGVEPAADSAAEAGRPAPAAAGGGGDAVRLSSDLQLVERAMRAANTAPDPQEAAARIRDLQALGTAEIDLEQLADRMIDDLLHSHDDRT